MNESDNNSIKRVEVQQNSRTFTFSMAAGEKVDSEREGEEEIEGKYAPFINLGPYMYSI